MPMPTSNLGGRADALETAAAEFARGELSAEQFRAQRVIHGIYEQRSAGAFMLRIGVPAGLIEASQLRVLGQLVGENGASRVYLTTRQDIQLHDLSLETAVRLSRQVACSGLTSFATGGNTVRNVVADPLSGLLPGDALDVHPYARAIASHYLDLTEDLILPRKFKIALSASALDRAGAVVADLGFVARLREGVEGFQVFVAGGLGAKPTLGLELFPWVDARRIGNVVRGVLDVFARHGQGSSRSRARLRHLRERLGESEFRTLCMQGIADAENNMASGTLPTAFAENERHSEALPTAPSMLPIHWQSHPAIITEKEWGRFSVRLSPLRGRLSPASLSALADAAATFASSTVRIGLEKEIWLTGVGGQAIDPLLERLRDLALGIPGEVVIPAIACLGAETCRLGVLRSGELPDAIGAQLRAAGAHWNQGVIRISGCPNGCARHLVAPLGFEGRIKRVGGRGLPVYGVFASGSTHVGTARLATFLGTVPARRIPELVLEVQRQQVQLSELDEAQLLRLRALIEVLGRLPESPPENYFRDWGSDVSSPAAAASTAVEGTLRAHAQHT